MRMTRHGILALALMAVAILAAGCQSSNSPSQTESPTAEQPAKAPRANEVANDGGQPGGPALPPAPQEGEEGGGFPPPGGGSPDERLREAAERTQLMEQKRDVVAQYFLDSAERFYRETKYKEARDNLLQALELNPNPQISAKATSMLRQIEDLLGIGGASEGVLLGQEVERMKVKVDQAVAQVRVKIQEGQQAMDRNDYDKAINTFDQALEILRWLPYHAPKRELQSQLESLKETALRRKQEWEAEKATKLRDESRMAAEAEERDRQEFLEEKISQLFRKANLEFRNEKYTLAEEYADQILTMDPFNKDASRLKEIAVRARNAMMADRNRETYIEEWTDTWEDVSRKVIPQNKIVEYPDEETWRKIEGRKVEEGTSATAQLPAEHREILNKLENQVVGSLEFEKHPLAEVIEFLRDNFDLNMMIDPELTRNVAEDELRVTLKVNNLSLKDALDLILSMTNLGYEIQEGVIVIKEKTNITGNQVSQVYGVQDLTLGINDFPGISLDLTSDTEGGLGATFGEDTSGGDPLNIDLLQSLIQENIAPGSWDAPNSIAARQGRLIIRHTPEVHAEIQNLLSQLRQSTGLLVSIETRFLTVRDDFLQDVGIDVRGLGAQSPRGAAIDRRTFRFPGVSPAFAAANPNLIARVVPTMNPLNLFNSAISDPQLNAAAGTQRQPGGNVNSQQGSFTDPAARRRSEYSEADSPLDDILFGVPGAQAGAGTDNTAGVFFDNGNESDVRGRIEHLFSTAFGTTSILTNSGGLNLNVGFLDEVAFNIILKAVEKSERINLLTAPRLTAFNTQRANVAVLRQFGYIKDFDVQVAQNATVADPIVGIVQDGVVLDVKPVISADRKFITMELQPAFAQVDQPIRTFVTTLGQAGQAVTIELPRVVLRKVETTVTIPDGGTIMIGGLTDFQERERQSDIPFIKRIPFVSFLFSKKQKLTFRENLVILVRAEIVYWKEIEPGPGLQR